MEDWGIKYDPEIKKRLIKGKRGKEVSFSGNFLISKGIRGKNADLKANAHPCSP